MKYYITKYALTTGIFTIEDNEQFDIVQKNSMIAKRVKSNRGIIEFYHKPDWHDNLPDTIKRAQEMKDKKLTSLEKQIKKLYRLDFSKTV